MVRLILLGFFLMGLTHCGYPGKDLNPLEKKAEIEWVFGTFERNYAPADWKNTKHGQSLEEIKAQCTEETKNVQRGDEFIGLLNQCVNRFQDAHTRIVAGGQALPEMIRVAYLGFQTEFIRFDKTNTGSMNSGSTTIASDPLAENVEVGLRVTQLLASTEDLNYPLIIDDIITKINGLPVKDYLLKNLVPLTNLGNELSSLTVAGSRFPQRDSTLGMLPSEKDVEIEFSRLGVSRKTVLPWTIKDFNQFMDEQRKAVSAKAEKTKKLNSKDDSSTDSKTSDQILTPWNQGYWIGSDLIDKGLNLLNKYRNGAGSRVSLLLSESFQFYSYSPIQAFLQQLNSETTPATKDNTDPFDNAIEGPKFDLSVAPFTARIVMTSNDLRIGYIRVSSFSLGDLDVKTFKIILAKMNQMKVKGVILDLLNNGGGSLVHGLAMANALTEKKLTFPTMQVALNDHWLNGFKADSLYGNSDAQKTLAARIHTQLKEDIAQQLRISRPISTTELEPFVLNIDKQNCLNDGTCLRSGTQLVLLVNEMCASMCDIFAGVFRDNKLGDIVGAQTMGAGGNVVMHGFSPITQVALTQTESLILDSNGKYLENQGIEPNIKVDTALDKLNKYSGTYKKALSLFQSVQ